jgi:hypothetical protein
MGRTPKEVFVVIVVDGCFGDLALIDMPVKGHYLVVAENAVLRKP